MSEGWLDANLVSHEREDTEGLKKKKAELAEITSRNPNRLSKLAPKGPIGPHNLRKWWPIDHVAEGKHGAISLWEWTGRALNQKNVGRYAILKSEYDGKTRRKYDLSWEGQIMAQIINQQRTDHLVTMVYKGKDYHKLYLEYCFNGNLQQDILRRQREKNFYAEEHVWRMFLCLIKGSMSLGGEHLKKKGVAPVPVILHLDLKPANIFLGDVEDKTDPDLNIHTCRGGYPILKIGDFGHAWPLEVDSIQVRDVDHPKKEFLKEFNQPHQIGGRGTPGYHPPEQRLLIEKNPNFSLDWEIFGNLWNRWGAAYGYSSKTNIWGIGAIMWQLICLNELSPVLQKEPFSEHNRFRHFIERKKDDMWPWEQYGVHHLTKVQKAKRYPEEPDEEIADDEPSIETYGLEILDAEVKARYSLHDSLLLDLVLICLSDRPRWRPSNSQLFDIVGKVCKELDERVDIDEPHGYDPASSGPPSPHGSIESDNTETETPEIGKDKGKGKEKERPSDRPPPPPNPNESEETVTTNDKPPSQTTELLPPHPDGSIRTWTPIPDSRLEPNPMIPIDGTSPITPDTTLPANMVPYHSPPTPTTPNSIAASREPKKHTAATKEFVEDFYDSSGVSGNAWSASGGRVRSPGASPRTRFSDRGEGEGEDKDKDKDKGKGKGKEKEKEKGKGKEKEKGQEKAQGQDKGKDKGKGQDKGQGKGKEKGKDENKDKEVVKEKKRPPRKTAARLTSCCCIPITWNCVSLAFWMVFLFTAILYIALCTFIVMIVEYEKHI